MRKYYRECGRVTNIRGRTDSKMRNTYAQTLRGSRADHPSINVITEQLITELLKAIHGQMGNHPGLTKVVQECSSKHYCPGLAKRKKKNLTAAKSGQK